MKNYTLIIFLIFCCIIIIYKLYKHFKKSDGWIDNNYFPEAQQIFDSRHIIKDELIDVLNSDRWGIWSQGIWQSDYQNIPSFTKLNENGIKSRLENSMGKINSTKEPSWRVFGLILNKKELEDSKFCPNTIKILNNSSNRILNAGFSLLEPRSYLGIHRDYNKAFYRLHIPLIIPKKNRQAKNSFVSKEEGEKLCVLQVENDYRVWKEDEYFIFDDTLMHNAWNNSDENRIILIVDLLRK
jgi:hypothetical protein